MADTVAKVITIFDASRGDCLGHGSSGIVLADNTDIVVKTASRFDIHPPGYPEEEQYSLRCIKEESAVFDILAKPKNWHPNIILGFLHTPDYIFMERAHEDLSDHLDILHADVRPPNILLSREGHVKLCDFDNNTCSFGQHIQAANVPYYQQLEDGSFGIAGATSEQGAIGCCTYFISTGTEPQDRSQTTSQIPVFGAIIRKCWDGEYQSVRELADDMFAGMNDKKSNICQIAENQASLMSVAHYEKKVAECREYLSLNGLNPTSANLQFPQHGP
ncbi:MAG: hypothetical protein Q9185_000535 [Variospora sp. 1 TL-2023]